MATSQSFRIGKVTVYLRGQAWYLRYRETGNDPAYNAKQQAWQAT